MLHFFRKYQKIFFIIITVVIIISFSFFGTYSALSSTERSDPVAFTTVDGSRVARSELEEMVAFISTDSQDKLLFGGQWGPNFLNDGVLKHDFLENGLAPLLLARHRDKLRRDLEQRHAKEKHFALYSHPQAEFLSVETAWSYFAPQMKGHFAKLKRAQDPASEEAFEARRALFLGEKQLPAPMLKRLLAYQERQYPWLSPDPALPYADLSLFGHHTFEDWFGPRFLRLAAQFIINSARIAEREGYRVTREEALADLMHNSAASYRENMRNPQLGVANSGQYFSEQLRRMRMTQAQAVRIWQKVLLFRRLFKDFSSTLFVAPSTFDGFNSYAKEAVKTELYSLPEPLRFNDPKALRKFEAYLDAVTVRPESLNQRLSMPTAFKPIVEIARETPSLVQKRYLLDIAHVDKSALENRISLKDLWKWETAERNWERLKKEFPELAALEKAEREEERFAALEALDETARERVDSFARGAIVDQNPHWIREALENAEVRSREVGIPLEGGKDPLPGMGERQKLLALLDKAPLKSPFEPLLFFTGDTINFYRIIVRDRTGKEEVLTFAEAEQNGLLDPIVNEALEKHYEKLRLKTPDTFKAAEGWKPLDEVHETVAESYFSPFIETVKKDYITTAASKESGFTPEKIAALRFYRHMRDSKYQLMKDPETAKSLTKSPDLPPTPHALSERKPLDHQWKLLKESYPVERSQKGIGKISAEEAFKLKEGDWSSIATPADGSLSFFMVQSKEADNIRQHLEEQVAAAREQLSSGAQRILGRKLLDEMEEKQALSLTFMDRHDQ